MDYPRRLPASETVWRGLRRQWVIEGQIQLVAFLRRPINRRTGQPEKGLSVGIAGEQSADDFLDEIPVYDKTGWKVGKLKVEVVEAIPDAPLYVEQDKPKHAGIMGTPLRSENDELSVALAQKLINATSLVP